jgi:four helix bundle protein
MENSETQVWLDFTLACEYINNKEYKSLGERTEEIGKLINHMITFPEKYNTNTRKLQASSIK